MTDPAEDMLRRKLARERTARERAEQLLEDRSRQLYRANERLELAGRGRLVSMLRLGEDLSGLLDLDAMLRRILEEARRLTAAEAGSIYLVEDGALRCRCSQNEVLGDAVAQRALGTSGPIPISLGSIAGSVAATGLPSNWDDVRALPPGSPIHFDPSFDERLGYRTRAMLSVPVSTPAGTVTGVLQLINPRKTDAHEHDSFNDEDELSARNLASLAAIAIERSQLVRSVIDRMIRMVSLRDPSETAEHAARVAELSVAIWRLHAEREGMDHRTAEFAADRLRVAAMLHDVGKIGVADAVLRKPGKLDPDEWAAMRQHAMFGAQLFEHLLSDFDRVARDVALYHHARWDGTGYPTPDELAQFRERQPVAAGPAIEPRGDAIPVSARIVAIADVFDALTSARSYKAAWPVEKALEEIARSAGSHFDPGLVELLPLALEQLGHADATPGGARDSHAPSP